MPVSEATAGELERLKERLDDVEADASRLDTQWRTERDESVRMRADFEALKVRIAEMQARLEKGGDRMWGVILIVIGTIANLGAAIFTAVRK